MGRVGGGAIGPPLTLLVPGALVAVALVLSMGASSASAQLPQPHWSIASQSQPTRFEAGDGSDAYVVIARNDGAAPTGAGQVVSLTDTVPPGVTVTRVFAEGESADGSGQPSFEMNCPEEPEGRTVTCTYGEEATRLPVLPGTVMVMTVTVSIPAGVTALGENYASVSGGGAPGASVSEATTISPAPAPFGLSLFNLDSTEEDGKPDVQAGSHPYELTSTLAFTVASREAHRPEAPLAAAAPKDLQIALPAGLMGNATATPRCSEQAFMAGELPSCPLDTQVGTIKPFFYGMFHTHVFPVYNLVPLPGQAAELGFSVGAGRVPLFLRVGVRADGQYDVTASLSDIPEAGPLQGAILTLWGVPAAGSHDLEREGSQGEGGLPSESCRPRVVHEHGAESLVGCPSGAPEVPFLTLPSRCQGEPLKVGVTYDTWEHPLETLSEKRPGLAAIDGCEQLSFNPSFALIPETTEANAPSGYTLDVRVPQDEDPRGLATPALHAATVSLPAGVTASASAAGQLQACSQAQFEPPPPETGATAPAACPPGSRIGTVKIVTPLLASPLEGQLFLGEPACSPCSASDAQDGRLIRVLAQVQGAGVTVKLEGSASIDQATGQFTVAFDDLPQLPFAEVQVALAGGTNALLVNPASSCGTPLTATAQLTPYSAQAATEALSAPFAVGGCPTPRFRPAFAAGTTDNQAGVSTPLTLTLARENQEQQLEALTVHLPPGLSALLSTVQPCPQAAAQALACTAQSLIGTVSVTAGPGPEPLSLSGSVYLTGPYEGAPFGLSLAVPAVAGPFHLGTIELGARVTVDPASAALTVASDPLPQRLDGIPLQLRTLTLDIDHSGLIVNPTDCRMLAIEGTATSTAGTSAAVSSRFQAANCATLAFKPKLTALTHAHASKAEGVHLHVRIVAAGGQANIAKLKLDLPKRMVPRLSTLQHACALSVFEAGPAGCPAASVVGSATILTPLLRVPLQGRVYVLSRGHAASPEIALALQGEGVAVEVVGQTQLAHGVESVAFRALPDVPFSQLDVLLEAGPHSLLASSSADGLCGRRLWMPTELTAQNGAVIKQTVDVTVSGCTRARKLHA